MKPTLLKMFVNVLYFVVFLALTKGLNVHKMHEAHGSGSTGQVDVYKAVFVYGITESEWIIPNNADVLKAIKQYIKNRKPGPEPILPASNGYRGYKILHTGKSVHTWVIPKCANPSIEIGLLEQTSNKQTLISQYLQGLKTTLNKCPKTTNAK